MFGNKHVDTCPDVIYYRNRAKKNARNTLIGYGVVFGGLYAYDKILEARENRKPNLNLVPPA